MSLQNFMVKAAMRLIGYKNRGDELTLEERQKDNLPEPPENIRRQFDCVNVEIDGANAVWLAKEKAANGVMVYLHGGSYTAGAFREQWDYLADMCRRTEMAAILIDYKLAPQNPFPAGLDDVLMIVETLRAAGELPENWFLLGDSAGAGLAAAAIFELSEAVELLPKKVILMCGWFDLMLEKSKKLHEENVDPLLSMKRMIESANAYIGDDDAKNPLISPLFGDPRNFPPTLMQCGTADMLALENREFYQKMLGAGVDVRYEEYDGLIHDFMMLAILPEALKARKSQAEFLLT